MLRDLERMLNIDARASLRRSATRRMTAPAGDETWHVYVHKLRAWFPDERTELPTRPYLVLITSTTDGAFLSCAHEAGERGNVFAGPEPPTCEEVVDFVSKVIAAPHVLNSSKAHERNKARAAPKEVRVACTSTARALVGENDKWDSFDGCAYVEGCREGFAKLGIERCAFAPVPKEIIEAVIRGQIEPKYAPEDANWGTQHLPGLMESVDGFTPEFGASLFGAAADFVKCAPWEALAGRRPVKVQYRLKLRDDLTMKLTAFVAVDGDLENENFGFTVHKTLTASQAAYEVENGNEDVEASVEGQTCMYASAPETPFEDLDASELYGWSLTPAEGEIDGALWPLFFKIGLDEETGDNLEISRPAIIELQCFELAMKSVAELITKGELKSKGDDVRDAKGPWTVSAKSFAAKGNEETIEIEIELPELAPMKPVEYL